MRRFLCNCRLILRLHYFLGTHILGASRGGPAIAWHLVVNCCVNFDVLESKMCQIRTVVLKDTWARIEAHGCELRHMGAHGAAWTRTDCTMRAHASFSGTRYEHFNRSSLCSNANTVIWCYLLCIAYCIRIAYKSCPRQWDMKVGLPVRHWQPTPLINPIWPVACNSECSGLQISLKTKFIHANSQPANSKNSV